MEKGERTDDDGAHITYCPFPLRERADGPTDRPGPFFCRCVIGIGGA